jgi:hypothetical protein
LAIFRTANPPVPTCTPLEWGATAPEDDTRRFEHQVVLALSIWK